MSDTEPLRFSLRKLLIVMGVVATVLGALRFAPDVVGMVLLANGIGLVAGHLVTNLFGLPRDGSPPDWVEAKNETELAEARHNSDESADQSSAIARASGSSTASTT